MDGIRQRALQMFDEGVKLVDAAQSLSIPRDQVRGWWVEVHGEEGLQARKRAAQSGQRSRLKGVELDRARITAVAMFHGELSLKSVAEHTGVHFSVVRRWWGEEFGETLMQGRARDLQRRKAVAHNQARSGPRDLEEIDVLCSGCGEIYRANRVSIARSLRLLCSECRGAERHPDRECPICGFRCEGVRGLASHVRHRCAAGDEAHRVWRDGQEDLRWVDKIENDDYVRCRECEFRGETLATHLKAHGLTADEYRNKHGDVPIRAHSLTERRSQAQSESWERSSHAGATKQIECPDCRVLHEVSAFLAPETHETRCDDCRAARQLEEIEAQWEGKCEPEDYVTCRLCGHRAEALNSHVQNAHAHVAYKSLFPQSLLVATGSVIRDKTALRLDLTEEQLRPFMDSAGRVLVAEASEARDCSQLAVRRYCRQLGLPTRNRLAFQKRVLDRVAEVLGGLAYEWEYTDTRIRNPETNYPLRYDGYFPLVKLLVEAHGRQHEEFIPYWHKVPENFERRVRLDLLKLRRAREEGYATLVVRQSDPKGLDEGFLRRRLLDLGIEPPRIGAQISG